MAEPPVLTIRREWSRPTRDMVAKFADTPSGFVVDALGRSGALDYGIRPVFPPKPFVGSALTVSTTARDNLTPYAALKVAKSGDVMLIATGDFTNASVVGDLIIGMMRNAGIVAVITDGLARDIAGITDVGIPVSLAASLPIPHSSTVREPLACRSLLAAWSSVRATSLLAIRMASSWCRTRAHRTFLSNLMSFDRKRRQSMRP